MKCVSGVGLCESNRVRVVCILNASAAVALVVVAVVGSFARWSVGLIFDRRCCLLVAVVVVVVCLDVGCCCWCVFLECDDIVLIKTIVCEE